MTAARPRPPSRRPLSRRPLSRRSLLGAAAAGALLPRLEAFADPRGGAAGSPGDRGGRSPRRFVTLFFPNGVHPGAWRPGAGADPLALGGSLAPLAAVKDRLTVVSGLSNPLAGHLGQTSGFLSGHDFTPTDDGSVLGRTSLDQMLARRWAGETYLPALNLAMEPPSQGAFGDRPRSFGNSISWQDERTKVEPVVNPRRAFDLVFFGQTAAGRAAAARRDAVVREVWAQSRALAPKVGAADRRRLDRYVDDLHALRAKLKTAQNPTDRTRRAAALAEPARPASAAPPADYAAHMRLLTDVLLLALQTDSTRVGTLVMGHSISRVVYDFAAKGVVQNHHALSHHRNDPDKVAQYDAITRWFAARAAEFAGRMAAIDEPDGTLLDNSVVLFGSGMRDGNTHEGEHVPIALLGGGGGALKTAPGGRRVDVTDGRPLAELHLSLLRAFGAEADDFNGVARRGVDGLLA